jgi:hypothetical protein
MVSEGKTYIGFQYFSDFYVTCVPIILPGAGRKVDGRAIRVQFAKYGPNSEKM